jgi:hypothetical protein
LQFLRFLGIIKIYCRFADVKQYFWFLLKVTVDGLETAFLKICWMNASSSCSAPSLLIGLGIQKFLLHFYGQFL